MTPSALAALNTLSQEEFVSALNGVFASGEWVAKAVAPWRPFADVGELHEAMAAVVTASSRLEQLDLLKAAPGLDDLRHLPASVGENQGQQVQLRELNARFRHHFGFPFILAATADYESLLASCAVRWENPQIKEEEEAIRELLEIARIRLAALLNPQGIAPGRLTVTVTDALTGGPAAGLALALSHVAHNGRRQVVVEAKTNADGEPEHPLLEGVNLTAGRYSLDLAAGPYFAQRGVALSDPPLIHTITVAFGVADPTENMRLALAISPIGYSVQRIG